MKLIKMLFLGVSALAVTFSVSAAPVNLKAYNIEKGSITVSGVSAGAIAANQLYFAYPETIRGFASISTVPFYCARGDVDTAIYECMGTPPDVKDLLSYVKEFSQKGEIGDLNLIKTGKAWVYASDKDSIVVKPASDVAVQLLKKYMNPANVYYHEAKGAEHSMPTDNFGAACNYKGDEGEPFINNCNFDAAGQLLKFFYGNLKPRSKTLSGKFVEYTQKEFVKNPTSDKVGLDTTGWAYVPKACDQGQPCKLHMYLHGCIMQYDKVGDVVVKKNGLNEWADSNNIVVLYPQGSPSADFSNPYACFDWWGYTGHKFYSRDGVQNKTLHAMLLKAASGSTGAVAKPADDKAAKAKAAKAEAERKAKLAAKKAEAERKRREAEAAKQAEAERKRKAAMKAKDAERKQKAKAEAERKRKAAEAAKQSKANEAKRKAEMEAKAAEERKRKATMDAEAERKVDAEAERKRKEAETEAQLRKAEEEQKAREAERARQQAAEAKRQAAEEAERKAAEEAKEKEKEEKSWFDRLFGDD